MLQQIMQAMRKDATSVDLVNNFGWRPPGDNFEKANTAAAQPNIAGQDNGIHKVNHFEICYPYAQPKNSTPLLSCMKSKYSFMYRNMQLFQADLGVLILLYQRFNSENYVRHGYDPF